MKLPFSTPTTNCSRFCVCCQELRSAQPSCSAEVDETIDCYLWGRGLGVRVRSNRLVWTITGETIEELKYARQKRDTDHLMRVLYQYCPIPPVPSSQFLSRPPRTVTKKYICPLCSLARRENWRCRWCCCRIRSCRSCNAAKLVAKNWSCQKQKLTKVDKLHTLRAHVYSSGTGKYKGTNKTLRDVQNPPIANRMKQWGSHVFTVHLYSSTYTCTLDYTCPGIDMLLQHPVLENTGYRSYQYTLVRVYESIAPLELFVHVR